MSYSLAISIEFLRRKDGMNKDGDGIAILRQAKAEYAKL
jgi:hypothetical protein